MLLYRVTRSDGRTEDIKSVNGVYFRVNKNGDLIVFDDKSRISIVEFPCQEWLMVLNMRSPAAAKQSAKIDLSPGMEGSPI